MDKMIKLALVALGLAACDSYQPAVYGVCSEDAECGAAEICVRSGECLAPDAVARPVTVTWTIDGTPPTPTTCARHPLLDLVFGADNGADPDLVLALPCLGSGHLLDRIPEHLLWLDQRLGPADVPQPSEYPNQVGWSSGLIGIIDPGKLEFELSGL